MNKRNAYAWFNKGYLLHGRRRYRDAIECFDKAIEIDSTYKNAWNNKGYSLGHLREYREAIECYNKAIEIDSTYKNAWNNKGFSLDKLGEYREAIECFDKATEIDPKYKDAWNYKGYSFSHLGEYREAIECYDIVIEIDPKFKYTWLNKGYALRQLGEYREAIDCYDKAIEIDPKFKYAWNDKGLALRLLKLYKESIECCNKAIEIDRKYVYAWGSKGSSLRHLEQYEKAIECFDIAIKIDPNYKFGWNDKGYSLRHLGEYREAIECYDKAIEINPTDVYAWNDKGYSFHLLGEYREAIECYDKAVEIDPMFKKAWNDKGSSLFHLEEYINAIECYDKAIEIDPKCEIAWIGKGSSLHRSGKYREAVHCYDKVLEIDPTDKDVWYKKGLSLFDFKKYREVIDCCDKVLEMDPMHNDAKTIKDKAVTYLKGEYDILQQEVFSLKMKLTKTQKLGASSLRDYKLNNVIAKGCDGIVFSASYKGEEYAIKVLINMGTETKLIGPTFDNEYKLIKGMDPSLFITCIYKESIEPCTEQIVNELDPSIRQYCTKDQASPGEEIIYRKVLWLAMEKYSMTLKEYISSTDANVQTKIILAKNIAQGLLHLDNNNIVHLDIKSNNIMINNEQLPVIIDFGYSKITENGIVNLNEGEAIGGNQAHLDWYVLNQFNHQQSLQKKIDYSKHHIFTLGILIGYMFFDDHILGHYPNSFCLNGLITQPSMEHDDINTMNELIDGFGDLVSTMIGPPDNRPSLIGVISTLQAYYNKLT